LDTLLPKLAQQLRNLASLFHRQRGERGLGDIGGDAQGSLRHVPSAFCKDHSTSAPVVWIVERPNEATKVQTINHSLDGCGIQIDQPAKMVL
jgi:hypothetical protein